MIAVALIAAVAAPTVTARVSPAEVTLGDRFDLVIEVVHDSSVSVNLPAAVDLGPAFAEEGRRQTMRDNGDGTVTHTFTLTVGAYDVGDHEVPPIPVSYAAAGTAATVQTPPLHVAVASFVGDRDAGLQPIAGPVEVQQTDWTVVYALAAVAAALALGFAALGVRAVLRRRARGPAAAAVPPVVPADVEALARLDQLEASGALDADDLDPAYTALSEILRAYLGRRFGFPALDLTTAEINAELAARPEAAAVRDELAEWLAACDLVKFAEFPATPDEARAALYRARQFVHRTRADAGASGPDRARPGAGATGPDHARPDAGATGPAEDAEATGGEPAPPAPPGAPAAAAAAAHTAAQQREPPAGGGDG
ncbi:MAG: hypothetical protein D6689_19690 [Deltaproteobacteria bacterium]|nr:MAG: hypothetical protein D6689_19690 [Deltaproteobacteria bacterium]